MMPDSLDDKKNEIIKSEIQQTKPDQELARFNELIKFYSMLLSNLNHEIRTPINSIVGFARMVNEETLDQNIQIMSDKIIKSAYKLLDTLNSTMLLSDLESGKIKAEKSEINLSELLRYIEHIYKNPSVEKKFNLEFQTGDVDLIITTDEKLLEQVLKNIIEYAIKSFEEGNIKIETGINYGKFEESAVVITLIYGGSGFPDNKLEYIFDPFLMPENAKSKYKLTEPGMSIANKIVKLLGGKIEFDIKKSSVLKILIHLPIEYALSDNKNIKHSNSRSDLKDEKNLPGLLIVEDYQMNVEIMQYFLDDIVNVEYAATFEDAIGKVNRKTYDIILMDIFLKNNESGFELMKQIRKKEEYKNTPVIAITGFTSAVDKEFFLKEGFTEFLPKPFDKDQLRNLIIQNI